MLEDEDPNFSTELDRDVIAMTERDLDLEASKSVQDDKTVIEMEVMKSRSSSSHLGCERRVKAKPSGLELDDEWVR